MALASVSPTVAGSKPKKLLDQTRDVLRLKHYSLRTERSYCDWIERRRKILRVGKQSALREARSGSSFDARRNCYCATRHRFMRRSTSSFRWRLRLERSRQQMLNSLLANGANGMSDIEGKVARESNERVWATSEFQHFGVARRRRINSHLSRRSFSEGGTLNCLCFLLPPSYFLLC
jgi:hypothetical protein